MIEDGDFYKAFNDDWDGKRVLTSGELGAYFDYIAIRLYQSTRLCDYKSGREVGDLYAALYRFDTEYTRLLQKYYDAIERLEKMAKFKGTRLETDDTPDHQRAWEMVKEISLVKQRWRKRKVAVKGEYDV